MGEETNKEIIGPAITLATLNLTRSCNLKCSYCFAKANNSRKKTMSFDMAKKCVDFLMKNASEADMSELQTGGRGRQVEISFWGGEPLIEWELIKKIAVYAEKVKPANVNLVFAGTTNGTLLTKDKFDFMEEHKIYFMLSFDGTEETHNKYRIFKNGKGSHSVVEKNAIDALKKWSFFRARLSLYPERMDHFYEDVKYLIDLGFNNIVFSPVYEFDWKTKHWNTFIKQGKMVVDLLVEHKKNGRAITIGHFLNYCQKESPKWWSCGAGKSYVGIDYDGSIWPCHRFCKFDDERPWQEKEMCIGHVEFGITRPEARKPFLEKENKNCLGCDIDVNNNCRGSCYAANFDIMGDIFKPPKSVCDYVKSQRKISDYCLSKGIYKDMKINMNDIKNCICYNMCYLQGTKEENIQIDDSGAQCHCYNTSYSGDPDTAKVAKPLNIVRINPVEVVKDINLIKERISAIEENLKEILSKLN
jgi:uncharacterized protein